MENITCYKCQRVGTLNCGNCISNWSPVAITQNICEACNECELIYCLNSNDCPTCKELYYYTCDICKIYFCGCDFIKNVNISSATGKCL